MSRALYTKIAARDMVRSFRFVVSLVLVSEVNVRVGRVRAVSCLGVACQSLIA